MFTILEGATVFDPRPCGITTVLLAADRIAAVRDVDVHALEATGLDVECIDASGLILTPGLIDPHEHLLGGSGESGFSSQTPMITLSEIVMAGITTVVGVLGVDTTMKTMAGLLARVKGLREEGLSAYLWSGGYNVPPSSVTRSIRDDMLFIEEIIGAGEVAIADHRGLCPLPPELAKLVLDTHVGGLLSGKSGRTHFHVGEDGQRLKRLRELLDGDFAVSADMLYPTHISRSEQLMDEAIMLAKGGSYVDIDTSDGDLARWLSYYLAHGGPPDRLTISSDAGASSPAKFLFEFFEACAADALDIEAVLPCFTTNTAAALKLPRHGRIVPGCRADVAVFDRDERRVQHLFANGVPLVKHGTLCKHEHFLSTSSRQISLSGAV